MASRPMLADAGLRSPVTYGTTRLPRITSRCLIRCGLSGVGFSLGGVEVPYASFSRATSLLLPKTAAVNADAASACIPGSTC